MWYRASIASGHTNKVLAAAALNGAAVLGPDTPAGARLGDTGRFLEAFTEDLLSRAEYWHAVFTGRGSAEAGERPPQDANADRAAAGGRS